MQIGCLGNFKGVLRLLGLLYVIGALGAFGCRQLNVSSSVASESDDHFLEKAAELLRAGELPTATELGHWRQIGVDAAIEEMFQAPAFANMVLDFNLYFLGARPGSLRPYSTPWGGSVFSAAAYGHPSAIHAAKEVAADGNFLSLFEQDQPLYVQPVARYEDELRGDDQLHALFEQARALFPATAEPLSVAVCAQFAALLIDDEIQETLLEARFQETITDSLRVAFRRQVIRKCYADPNDTNQTAQMLRTALDNFEGKINALYRYEAEQNRSNYPQRYVSDIRDGRDVLSELGFASNALTREGYWRTYVNSSTNFNRKRARYILDRYFCDDLTPVDLPNTLPHGSEVHAADPACQSCHYRLDPLAGFFRYSGYRGRNRQGSDYIDFDDNANFEGQVYEAYMNSWRNADATSTREWNIGYVRDPSTPSRNIYGESLSDLFAVFQSAPEVRQCVVKRMAEYVLGKNQAVDGGWLAQVGAPLLSAEPQASGRAFKRTLKDMILSEGFAARDPDPERCYDGPNSAAPAGAVPCRVAWIIDASCKTCHSAVNPTRGLDLTTWVEGPGGRYVFKHLTREADGSARQLSRAESFERIRARLSTQQGGLIMPPTYMAPELRIAFLQYLSQDEVNP